MAATMQEQLEELARQDSERIQRAVERGGLPTEADADELAAALQHAFDVLEGIASRVDGISLSGDGHDLPFAVTLADLGVLAIITENVNRRTGDFARFSGKIAARTGALDSIRVEQGTT